MKIKFLIAGLLGFLSINAVFAQSGVLSDAKDEYDKYTIIKSQKAMTAQATTGLNTAKTLIDKAAVHPKTANLPLTYAVKGAIYAELAYRDTIPSTSTPLFITADEALKKAKELDTKGESKKLIDNASRTLVQIKLNKGVKDFGSQKYDAAYEDFDYYRNAFPEDTTAIYYTGLAAANAGYASSSTPNKFYEAAIKNYTKLLSTNFSKKPSLYGDLPSLYLKNKDTTNALKAISEAVEKYPKNSDLSNKEINFYLMAGKKSEVINKLQKAIENDPKNKVLYYNAGILYTQTKEYTKAEAMYKKALEIDPDYFEANLNLGYILFNPGIEIHNKANKLPTDAAHQKQYKAEMAKADAIFDLAKPYLLKAVEVNPKSKDALANLRNYYLGKNDMVNANAIQKRIEALK